MSADWTIACAREPRQELILGSVATVMPEHYVRESTDGLLLEILDDGGDGSGSTVIAIELPRLVRVPAELDRLLHGATVTAPAGGTVPLALTADAGAEAREQPVWWLDLHATAPAAGPLADTLAHTIAGTCDGAVVGPRGEA